MRILHNLSNAINILGMAVYIFRKWESFMYKVISILKSCDFSLEYVQHIICIPSKNLYIEDTSKSFKILFSNLEWLTNSGKFKKIGNQGNDLVWTLDLALGILYFLFCSLVLFVCFGDRGEGIIFYSFFVCLYANQVIWMLQLGKLLKQYFASSHAFKQFLLKYIFKK